MPIEAVTESGSRYRIDVEDSFWIKICKHGLPEPVERIWSLKVGTKLVQPWNGPEFWEDASTPEVGKHLYISGKDVWYVSTLIVEVREIEELTSGLRSGRLET